MNYTTLAAQLRAKRKQKGYSQAEIARILGVSFQNVSSWELGKSKIDLETFARLCQLYSLDPSEAMGLCINPSPLQHDYDQLDDSGKDLIHLVMQTQLERIHGKEDEEWEEFIGIPYAARGGGVAYADKEKAKQFYRLSKYLNLK